MNDEISQIILDELREHRRESNQRHADIDKRIRHVEKWQANANGKITIIASIGVALGGFFTWLGGIFIKNG